MFTKSLDPGKYSSALKMIGVIPYADRPSRTRPPAAVKTDRSKLVENKMDKNKVNKNKTEKNDVEKAAPAIVFNSGNYQNFRNNETSSSSSSTARWKWDPREKEYVAEPRYIFFSLQNGPNFETELYHARGECGLICFPVCFDTNKGVYGFCAGATESTPSSVLITNLRLYSGLGIRPCCSHRAEDFAGRNSCLPDSRTGPVFRLQTSKMTRMSKPIRQNNSSV